MMLTKIQRNIAQRARVWSAILLTVLFVVACEDEIEVDLRSADPQLVIEGVIRQGSPAEVLITRSKAFSDNTPYTPVTDAVVTISDDAGNNEQLSPNAEGKYVAVTIQGVERRQYHLTVQCDGETYTAHSKMPPAVAIDSLTLWKFSMVDYWEPMAHFRDPAGAENQYYRFVVAINGEYPRLKQRLLSTEFTDGAVIHQPMYVRYEEDSEDEDPIKNGDVLLVEMRCLDKGTYTFLETMDRASDALANPTNNITGGALGYFGAYSYSQMSIVAKW